MKLRDVGFLVFVMAALLVTALASSASGASPIAHASATCSDYSNQADAQRNKDTIDADGDGIYCEALPCPCSTGGGGGGAEPAPPVVNKGPS